MPMFRSANRCSNLVRILAGVALGSASIASAQIPDAPTPPPDDPVLTMAPHPENSRYWISGQANIIFQGRLPFHSLYEGPNSFRNSGEYKTSMVGTFYTALRPTARSATTPTSILDFESRSAGVD